MVTTEVPKDDTVNEDEISTAIDRFGVQLVIVTDDPDSELRPYIYTIGLRRRGMPELIAFADEEEQLNAIGETLSRLALRERIVAPGERLKIGGETLVAALPDAELDALLQEQCLIEARAYYRVARLDLLVLARERELTDPIRLH
jgi:hypothetical protein